MPVAHMDTVLREERYKNHWASTSGCVEIHMNA